METDVKEGVCGRKLGLRLEPDKGKDKKEKAIGQKIVTMHRYGRVMQCRDGK